MKTNKITTIIIIIWIIFLIFLISQDKIMPSGIAASANTGCCLSVCQETSANDCFGPYSGGIECNKLDTCNIGCCIDKEGYCLSNYLKGNCLKIQGEFIDTKECLQTPRCIMGRPQNSILGYTGYPGIYNNSVVGFPFADPISYIRSDPVKLKFLSLRNISMIKIKLTKGVFSEKITLYDEGNSIDRLYGGLWQSWNIPGFNGVEKINLTAIADGEKINYSDYFLLSSTKCLPFRKPWNNNETTKNVIFIGSENVSLASLFKPNTENFIGQIYSIQSFRSKINDYNYYRISDNLFSSSISKADEKVNQLCTYYNKFNDTIIFYDNNYEYCQKINNVIRVNPSFIINRSALEDSNMTDFLNNFCSYINTQKELYDSEYGTFLPPNVTLITPLNNSKYNKSEVNIMFKIFDNKDNDLIYRVYLDADNPATIISNGITQNNTLVNITLNIPDGPHEIWIEAEDSDMNFGYSRTNSIFVNKTGFYIIILTLDKYSFDSSPDINFTIFHNNPGTITYRLHVNDNVLQTPTATVGKIESIKTNLPKGLYNIKITAEDFYYNIAETPPYEIEIISPNP